MTDHDAPIITTQCAGCGLVTLAAGEWYMVDDGNHV
jgi:hypothetical protein